MSGEPRHIATTCVGNSFSSPVTYRYKEATFNKPQTRQFKYSLLHYVVRHLKLRGLSWIALRVNVFMGHQLFQEKTISCACDHDGSGKYYAACIIRHFLVELFSTAWAC